MFNVYLDDSGTSPSQRIAIASALIIPAGRALQLEREWKSFCAKYKIPDYHSSECVHKNPKSPFALWDDVKVSNAVGRVRQITKKYAVRAISYAITKADYDEEVPEQWKDFTGRDHYAWAVRHVLRIIFMWSKEAPGRDRLEYIFDTTQDKRAKAAIEKALGDEELIRPGCCEGHYMFRRRQEWAGLQCADLLAWSSLSGARLTFEDTPINPQAELTLRDFRNHQNGKWLTAAANSREQLRASLRKLRYSESGNGS